MVYGQLIGAAVGIGSSLLEKRAASKRRKKQRTILGRQQARGLQTTSSQLIQEQKGLQAQRDAYSKAEKLTSSRVRTEKRRALEKQKEIAASLQARYGGGAQTTAFQNALSGLSSRSTRDLADIDAAFADQLSSLAIGRGDTEAAGRGRIAARHGAIGSVQQSYLAGLAGIENDEGPGAYDFLSSALAGAQAGGSLGGGGGYGGGQRPPSYYQTFTGY